MEVDYDINGYELLTTNQKQVGIMPNITQDSFDFTNEKSGVQKVTIGLFCGNEWLTLEEVLNLLKRNKQRPIDALELCTLGVKFPWMPQDHDMIVGLGSEAKNTTDLMFPFLRNGIMRPCLAMWSYKVQKFPPSACFMGFSIDSEA